ncbi:FAD-dependent oxidoreductase [Pantoea rwandensis]|uniref:FAD-dependent oxidoreductase n=1 Tax=Pantoea rwandensis TaxID=1076550 RepID=A0A1X1D3G5_9GAMM|nr:FAD-dependent oxidoreductase [Pantoea rwandensis]ORM71223.1 FAD-dependent oxidoreductase [Pantoea rwandensis]
MNINLHDSRGYETISCDVLVVGGGAAGLASAVTAARQGKNVVLLERYGFCGGGAVAGLSGTVCGLYLATQHASAGPEQIVFGFTEEFCQGLSERGGLSDPIRYGETWTRVHDPLKWRMMADHLLVQAGVTVIYHSVAMGVLIEGGEKTEGVIAWTKQGPLRINAQVTIDASGDADVVAMAGLPDIIGDNGNVQNPTMIFHLQGVDMDRFLRQHGADTIMDESVSALIVEKNRSGDYNLPRSKIWLFPTTQPGELLCNCTRINGSDGRELNSLFYRDFSEAEINGRTQATEYARFFRDHLAGCENAWISDTAPQVGIRQTRQLDGVGRLNNSHVVAGTKNRNSIARSAWPIELHSGDRPRVQWLMDDYYDIPYDCFIPKHGTGLLTAGRCLSAEHEAVASARVTAQCFAYGHAIGHAAAIAINNRLSPGDVSPDEIRTMLRCDGAHLD